MTEKSVRPKVYFEAGEMWLVQIGEPEKVVKNMFTPEEAVNLASVLLQWATKMKATASEGRFHSNLIREYEVDVQPKKTGGVP